MVRVSKYTDEVMRETHRLSHEGYNYKEIAEKLLVSRRTLRNLFPPWCNEHGLETGMSLKVLSDEQLAAAEKETKKGVLQQEIADRLGVKLLTLRRSLSVWRNRTVANKCAFCNADTATRYCNRKCKRQFYLREQKNFAQFMERADIRIIALENRVMELEEMWTKVIESRLTEVE